MRPGSCACGVGLVGIDVHCQSVLRADSDYHVAEYERASVGIDLHADNLLVTETELLGVLGSCMDMSLRRDNAALKLYFALGADKLAAPLPATSPLSLTGAVTPIERASVSEIST